MEKSKYEVIYDRLDKLCDVLADNDPDKARMVIGALTQLQTDRLIGWLMTDYTLTMEARLEDLFGDKYVPPDWFDDVKEEKRG
jgi:hypothetical protein